MPVAPTSIELWRRLALLGGVLVGVALFFLETSYASYRTLGIIILLAGLFLYIFLPRRKKVEDDISYSTGSMKAGDLAGLILLLPFYGLPFVINGGTTELFTYLWPVTVIMWALAFFPIILLYYNAWYASYRIELTSEAIYLINFKGIKTYRFDEITQVNYVVLRNPRWFRRLFLIVALLAMLGGRSSTQPAGSALLTESAAYGGLEFIKLGVKPTYIWFTSQNGGVIINNFNRVPEALRRAGIITNDTSREIEGFAMFM